MNETCFIFGAGKYGQMARCDAEHHGACVIAFLDNDKRMQGREVHGVRCIALEDVEQKDRACPVVIALKSREAQESVKQQLATMGFSNIRRFGEKDVETLWMSLDDEEAVRLQWSLYMGDRPLDLVHPKTFNEKLQWLKLYDRNPLYTTLVDKAAVKPWVAERIGADHVIPTLGVWDSFDAIDFDQLPEKFVLKCTHDSGSVVFCKGKQDFDREAAREILMRCLERNYFWQSREWPYKDVPPCILAEPYLVDESGVELKDYKVQDFDGVPKLIQVDFDRFSDHKRNLYDPDWNYIPASILYPTAPEHPIPRPAVLQEMLSFARKLSSGIPYVRTDFYVIGEQVLFGEMTFYHGSGFEPFTPQSFETEVGSWIHLPAR